MNQIVVIVLKAIVGCINEILATDTPPVTDARPPAHEFPPIPDPASVPTGHTVEHIDPPKGDLDSEGIPWDDRIHSGGKTKYASGSNQGQWKLKRGMDAVTVAQVKTELTVARQSPDPEVPLSRLTIVTWAQLVEAVTVKMLAPDIVQAACVKFNVENLGALQDVPILIPMVARELGV